MRGKARHCAAVHGYRGITPAHAGKSFTSFYHCTTFWDHPRTCGEKLIPPLLGFGLTGSPPHMRGKERGSTSRQRRKGITPAHAGKSPAMSPGHITLRDHPRTCGEKGISDFSGNYEDGSPPHMRGKARSPLLFPGISRITPAHAGKRLKRSRSIVPHAAIVPLFPSVCNKPAGSDGSPAGHDAPPFLPIENAAPASPAYNLRSL